MIDPPDLTMAAFNDCLGKDMRTRVGRAMQMTGSRWTRKYAPPAGRGVGRRVLAGIGAALLTTAFASHSYMGISLAPGATDPQVQDLAQRARSGDKQAQLDLGIRFEEGKGVPQDRARAIKLYRQAATDSGGMQWIYMPSPGNGAPGRVMPVDRGPRQPGLEEAMRELEASK